MRYFRGRGVESIRVPGGVVTISYLSDTLLVLATVQDGPGDAARVLALEEEGLGFAVLEAEDLGVATDVDLALQFIPKKKGQVSIFFHSPKKVRVREKEAQMCPPPSSGGRKENCIQFCRRRSQSPSCQNPSRSLPIAISNRGSFAERRGGMVVKWTSYLSRVDSLAREGVVVRPHFGWWCGGGTICRVGFGIGGGWCC